MQDYVSTDFTSDGYTGWQVIQLIDYEILNDRFGKRIKWKGHIQGTKDVHVNLITHLSSEKNWKLKRLLKTLNMEHKGQVTFDPMECLRKPLTVRIALNEQGYRMIDRVGPEDAKPEAPKTAAPKDEMPSQQPEPTEVPRTSLEDPIGPVGASGEGQGDEPPLPF